MDDLDAAGPPPGWTVAQQIEWYNAKAEWNNRQRMIMDGQRIILKIQGMDLLRRAEENCRENIRTLAIFRAQLATRDMTDPTVIALVEETEMKAEHEHRRLRVVLQTMQDYEEDTDFFAFLSHFYEGS